MTTRDEWQGRVGQEWARRAEALERLLAPAGAAGLAALDARPGERVLDLGCGAGASTLALARAVGQGGRVVGVDVSPDLLAAARARLAGPAGLAGVELVEADAGRHDFGEARFDALFSRFGSMFFEDPAAALARLRGAVKPGGRAVFVCWRGPRLNEWASIPARVAAAGAQGGGSPATPPEPGAPGPFGWADPDYWRSLLEGAGFGALDASEHDFKAEISEGENAGPVARAVGFMSSVGPMARHLRDLPDAERAPVLDALAERLRGHVEDGAVRLRAAAWVIRART